MTDSLYESNFFDWITLQAELLRGRRFDELDIDNLAREVEAVGRSQNQEVRRRLARILHNMLAWKYQPEQRSRFWAASLLCQRHDLAAVLAESPSLRGMVEEALPGAYQAALAWAAQETGLARLPARCEWTGSQVMDAAFLP